ncbi:ABC transporter ATP-binding protein [Mangrovihabitans endophyticus]|uniref:Sugar ABC transporter ATP-binding protein n=1 Tax=Mangrovihabitans endophyticus TaxID=1751298 RepID=A0A8J3C0W9_9ACTN|nr:ABC transporter ATP-binding protein [Mangrovihabitans endophyticus]GGK91432.1 sugar ABC transporter ATP-binding protein [Mangrovihabitans endophyticus]
MATLELEGVTTRYGKVVGVEDLELTVGDGEFFVVLGPSGAGKTTTLKSVAGLVDMDAGRVSIGGRDMGGVEPYHRNVAMAFESYALYPQKTVFENLASPLRSGRTGTYDKAEQSKRIELVTTTLGINHLLKRFPRELSNGQRQRVALGRVLVRPADVYLLDEPLSHLDAKLRAAMRAELKQLGEDSSTTSLYVTHDYQEALDLGERIAVLRHGRLVQVGTPEQIWREPADTFVAKALGQPEINLLDGEVTGGRIVAAGGAVSLPVPSGVDVGDRVRVGLRPRDLDRADADPDGGAHRAGAERLHLRGRVHLAERLGRLVELSIEVGDTEIIMVAGSDHAPGEGDVIDMAIDLADVHLFAPGAPGEETARLGSGRPR